MYLNVYRCNNLRYLFSFSMAKHLSQLRNIQVTHCEVIKEVVVHDDECTSNNDTVMTTIFPKLHTVRLKGLPGLLTFCSSKLMSSPRVLPLFSEQDLAPCLRELDIQECGSIKYLFSSTFAATLSLLVQLKITECTMMEEIIKRDEDMGFQFPILKYLMLDDLPKLKKFYTGRSLQFPELVEIKLSNCPQLVTFVSNSLSTDNSEVSKGPSYPARVPLFTDEVVAPNLTELGVGYCRSLESLCSSCFAAKLAQLKQLEIYNCRKMEEIIMSMDDKIVDKIEFLQLKHLMLVALPRLRGFCSGICPVQLPSGFNLVTSTNNPMWSNNNVYRFRVTLFNDSVAFPSLESMRIEEIHRLNAIWHNEEVANSLFCQLKEVHLSSVHHEVIEDLMLRRPQNLMRLEIKQCDISEEVSLPFLEVTESTDSYATLQNSQFQLRIRRCQFEMALLPSTISLWKNVTFLWVDSCDGPENLLTYEAAQCLQQLKAMIISDCTNLVEVVANGGHNTEGGVITFSQLEFLLLEDLPKLRSFCAANSILRFPKLTHIGVNGCSMMTFSNELTETPQIKKVTMKFGDALLDDEYIEHLKPEDFNSLIIFGSEEILDRVSVDDLLDSEVNVNNTIEHLRELQTGMILRELFAEQEIELFLTGLENAGRTSLIQVVTTGGYSEDMNSRVTYFKRMESNMKKVTEGNVTIKSWNRGQPSQEHCCAASAIVYVVDAADPDDLSTSRSELHGVLSMPGWAGMPLLVLGNKIDKPGALSEKALADEMELNSIDDREVCCFMISCKNSTNIDSVIDWFVKHSKPKS